MHIIQMLMKCLAGITPCNIEGVAQLEVGPSSGSLEGDLEWPYPEDPSKARFVLRDSQEHQLWNIFGGQGHAVMSKLTKLSMKLESTRKQAQFAW